MSKTPKTDHTRDLIVKYLRAHPGATTKQIAYGLALDHDVKDGTLRAAMAALLQERVLIKIPSTYRIADAKESA
jgi:hypothetical protein